LIIYCEIRTNDPQNQLCSTRNICATLLLFSSFSSQFFHNLTTMDISYRFFPFLKNSLFTALCDITCPQSVVAIWPYLKLIARNIMFFSVGLLLAVVIINSLFKACFGKSEQNCNIVKYPNFDLVIFPNILRKFGIIWLFFHFWRFGLFWKC